MKGRVKEKGAQSRNASKGISSIWIMKGRGKGGKGLIGFEGLCSEV